VRARIVLEACVEEAEGAAAVELAGADRVELCAGLAEGGTTPSLGCMEAARAAARLPIVALVRPRPGDFVYAPGELALMRRDVRAAREAGLDGVALGVLTPDARVDVDGMRALVEEAGPLAVTFHRAFDLVAEPERELGRLAGLGVRRVLTSGGAASAAEGAQRLARLVALAEGIVVVAAGGIRAANAAGIVSVSGVREVHASAMADAEPGGGLGRRIVDEERVRALVAALGT
jgi:copper homeostasis protein